MSDSPLTSGVSHVGLAVSKLDKTVQFFEAIGFKKVGGSESYPSVFVSDGTSLITLWQTEDNATPFDRRKNVGLHHLAIKIPSLEALTLVYEKVLKVDGVTNDFGVEPIEGTPWTHAMVFEPSGCRIEFTHHGE